MHCPAPADEGPAAAQDEGGGDGGGGGGGDAGDGGAVVEAGAVAVGERHNRPVHPLVAPLAVGLAFLLVLTTVQGAAGIDCFKCVSVNGDNPSCEDPFHNNFSRTMLESPCMAGRKGREGLFPATACIKLAGIYDDSQRSIVVRACALDSGTLTTDTEIIRMSHCGGFYFEGKYVKGCLQSCDDYEGCNSAPPTRRPSPSLTVAALASAALLHRLLLHTKDSS